MSRYKHIAINLKYPDLQQGEGKDFYVCNEGRPSEIFEWNTEKYPKPTDDEMQQWHSQLQYLIDRVNGTTSNPIKYAPLQDQEDMKYWDAINGTTTWVDHITSVKEAHKKPEA